MVNVDDALDLLENPLTDRSLHGVFGNYDVYNVSPGFLIVLDVVSDVADDMLCLLTFHPVSHNGASQQWIFFSGLERPSIPRIPRQIHPAPSVMLNTWAHCSRPIIGASRSGFVCRRTLLAVPRSLDKIGF